MANRGRWTVGRLMLGVAAAAVLLAAAIYRRDNADVDRASIGLHLREVRSSDPAVRLRAAEAFERTDLRDAPAAIDALAGLIVGDPTPVVRRVAARSMGVALARSIATRGGPTPAGPDISNVGAAAEDDLPARVLIRAMADADPGVRRAAVSTWDRLPGGSRFAPDLAPLAAAPLDRLLLDADPDARAMALRALPRLGPALAGDRGRVIALIERDPKPFVRSCAIQVLAQLWPTADLYAILLTRHHAAPTAEERSWIAYSLGRLPPPRPEVIPGLLDLMEADPIFAQTVPQVLARLGRAGRPWLARLHRAAERELAAPANPLNAARAVVQIDPNSPAAQALLGRLVGRLRDSREWFHGQQAADLIASYGRSAAPAVLTLREALADPADAARERAAHLLGRIGPAAFAAADDLDRLSRADPDESVRRAAALAVSRIRRPLPRPGHLPEAP